MSLLDINKLNHRVALLQPSTTRNSCNEAITTWSSAGEVWAYVEPLSGNEAFKAKQIHATMTYRVTVRYNPSVNSKWRVQWGSTVLEILSAVDWNGQHEALVLNCTEVL